MKKFSFRLQVVLDMRERELEARQMEMAKILAALNSQQEKLNMIQEAQVENTNAMEALYTSDELDISQVEGYRGFGIKLVNDERTQEMKIANTRAILERKKQEVRLAHQKVEVLKKLKEKQESAYYKEILDAEMKELDDMTSARYRG